jgi:23S rRNA (uracil1939-C5)-methyltransferase
MKQPLSKTLTLEKIVGGGQTLGSLDYGKKAFVWGGLPGEKVTIVVTKKKSSFLEGVVTEVVEPSAERIEPVDGESYLSTSPWQIMTFASEQHYKAALVEEAFELHDIVVPEPIDIYTDGREFGYRNKIEFSWWWDKDAAQLDLAFFRRGTHGKTPVEATSLAHPAINTAAQAVRDVLRARGTQAYALKTLIVRCDQSGTVVAQLYVKDEDFAVLSQDELTALGIAGFELIFSNPKSPASVITHRMQTWGTTTLTDSVLGVPFTYAVEGFFQINIPVYEQALRDMKEWIDASKPTVDLYSGVGTIGLTIGGEHVTMVEINEHAVREMERNITALEREKAVKAILAPSEQVLDTITGDATIIVDPPRAGLHEDVIQKLLEAKPARIVYLSCNPVTQARDVARLAESYGIRAHKGYNFFPRTPHIEHLAILDLR